MKHFINILIDQKGNEYEFHRCNLSKTLINCLLSQDEYLEDRLTLGLSGDFGEERGDTIGFLGGGCLKITSFKRLCCPYKFLWTVQMKPDHNLHV